jgi:DNA mismatch repair protein MutS2
VRDGRYVIPVRREGAARSAGSCTTRARRAHTLFVEPPIAIELMNRLRELELAEAREVQRILRELTERCGRAPEPRRIRRAGHPRLAVRPRALRAARQRAAAGDRRRATARIVHGGTRCCSRRRRDVVPFDLRMEPGERTLLVSGPNTGGKTVLLKAIGLIAALTQAA